MDEWVQILHNGLWDAANRYLHANLPKGTKTLPIAEWEQEYADLKTQRDSDYTKLKETRAEVLLIRLAIWLMLTPIFCSSAVCARTGPVSIWTI